MGSQVYSHPLVHTVYYSREVFPPEDPEKTEALEALFLQALGFGDRIQHQDFAFNEHVNCSNAANGIFMRLNACSLLKLRHWCLYPTDSTVKKIVQYLARIFLSPVAALVDLVVNVALMVFKLSAWPILHIVMHDDEAARECLVQNLSWHFSALAESLFNVGQSVLESLFSLAGPTSWGMDLWGYSVTRYEGPDIPFVVQSRNLLNRMLPVPEEVVDEEMPRHYEVCFLDGKEEEFLDPQRIHSLREHYEDMSRHYEVWFREGKEETILDPQRVRYLQEHCGWDDLSAEQLKEIGSPFPGFASTKVAFQLTPDVQNFHVIINGSRRYATEVSVGHKEYSTLRFIRSLFLTDRF